MKASAVIFDLDGTLLDSADDILAALVAALRSEGIEPPSQLDQTWIGPPIQEILVRSGLDLDEAGRNRVAQAFRTLYDGDSFARTKPYPGAQEVVAQLIRRGLGVFVATNKPVAPSRRLLARYFPTLEDRLVCVDSLSGQRLSKAEMIQWLGEKYHLNLAACWMVGDGVSDMTGAVQNGCVPVAVTYGYGRTEDLQRAGARVLVDRLDDLLERMTNDDQG